MLKKTITYLDFDDVERTEDFYFNLSKAEVLEMEMGASGGLSKMLEKITKERDNKRIVEIFKDVVLRAYGEKSPDGKRFIKSKELSDEFAQTTAYSDLFMELATNEAYAVTFIKGILPQQLEDHLQAKK